MLIDYAPQKLTKSKETISKIHFLNSQVAKSRYENLLLQETKTSQSESLHYYRQELVFLIFEHFDTLVAFFESYDKFCWLVQTQMKD